jgi:hypothetical protein
MFGLTNLLGLILAPLFAVPTLPAQPTDQFYAEWDASSTAPGYVAVHSTVNGVSSTTIMHAPFGLRSEIETVSNGTSTETYASSTPITQSDIAQMEEQQQTFEADVQRETQDEQKLFQDMWSGLNF